MGLARLLGTISTDNLVIDVQKLQTFQNEIYTSQVAVHSSNGVGQHGDLVYAMLGTQGN